MSVLRVDRYDQNFREVRDEYEVFLLLYLRKHFENQVNPAPIVNDALADIAEILTNEPERIGRLKSYLRTVVRNAALKEIGKPLEELPIEIPMPNENEFLKGIALWLGLPENAHKADICYALAEKLPDPCQTILKLYLEGKSLKYIAEAVGMKYDSVKSKKSQCINSLKTLISKL